MGHFLFLLQMKVTGNNLTNTCMVVYRVAKTEKNDQLFLEEDILSKINYLLLTVSYVWDFSNRDLDWVIASLLLLYLERVTLKVTCCCLFSVTVICGQLTFFQVL